MNYLDYPSVVRKLQQAYENGSTPGLALLFQKEGTVLFRHALGEAQRTPVTRPLTDTAIFDIASLTKVVATTTACMLLLHERQLTLDTPVHSYFPEFTGAGKEHVTIRHLLTHSAGLVWWLPFYEQIQPRADQEDEEFIGSPEARQCAIQQILEADLASSPGEQYTYSDLGFILLGAIIEQITGTTLDQFCNERIFVPLGMTTSFFRRHGAPLPDDDFVATERCEWRRRVLCGEVHDENAYALGGVSGHAGLFSTLDDLQRFMDTLERCYRGESDFLPQAIVQQFFERQHLPDGSTRALGWDTPSKPESTGGTLLSPQSVGHTGFTGASIWFDVPRRLIIILLSNRVHPSRINQRFLKMRPKIHDAVVISTDEAE